MKSDELTYTAKVEDGKIKMGPIKRNRMAREVGRHFEGKEIEMIIRKKKNRRTTAQNAWYWGVCIRTLYNYFVDWDKSTLITPDSIHEMMKEQFLPIVLGEEKIRVVTPHGEVLEAPYTTKVLTTTQFMDYKALIQNWAAELDIYIPDPNEGWEELKEIKLEGFLS